jgi:glycosyltransferase involved in cell wall biosynthesis
MIIIGRGELENHLKNLARELNIEESLLWVEHTNDVHKYMCKIQTFVLPSKYEGFGLVLLEAINARCAILAANNSAIPEVLGEDFEGLFNTGSILELSGLMEASLEKPFRDRLQSLQDLRLMRFNPTKMELAISDYYSES